MWEGVAGAGGVVEERSSQSQDAFGVQAAGHSEEGEGRGRGAGAEGGAGEREEEERSSQSQDAVGVQAAGHSVEVGRGGGAGHAGGVGGEGGRGGAGSEEGARLPAAGRPGRARGPPERYVAEPASGAGPSQPRTASRSSSRGAVG